MHPDLLFTHLQGVELHPLKSTNFLARLLGGCFILHLSCDGIDSSVVLSVFDMTCLADDSFTERSLDQSGL